MNTYTRKGVNPLYSAYSFSKYFYQSKRDKHQEPRKGLIYKRNCYEQVSEHVEGMNKLLREMKKIRKKYPTNEIDHKIDML
jgi:hypothetical protein